jgi:hypothetical protein
MPKAESLSDLGLKARFTIPCGLDGTLSLYRDETHWGVLLYIGPDARDGRIFRPVLPPGASFADQLAEVERFVLADRAGKGAI